MFPDSLHHHKQLWGWDQIHKIMQCKAEKYEWTVPYLSYLEIAKHELPVQIWSFHSIPTKNVFFENLPQPSPPFVRWGLVNMTFLCRSGYFMQCLEALYIDFHSTPWGMQADEHEFLYRSGSFVHNNFGEMDPTHHHSNKGVGLASIIVLCTSGHFIQFLANNFWWKSIPHPSSRWGDRLKAWLFCANQELSCNS